MLNHKKLYRLCGEERLVARAGVSERIGTSAPMALPQGPDQRLSFDFVSGAVACGRIFWMLAVFDDFTRECLALMVDLSLSGIPRCSRARPHRRKTWPTCLVTSDNGTNEHLFAAHLAEARRIIEPWRVDYYTARPHSSLGGLTPTAFAARPSQEHNQNGLCL